MRSLALSLLLLSAPAAASPNVPLDHPVYEELATLFGNGTLRPFSGGFRPLTMSRVRQLLASAHAAQEPGPGEPRDGEPRSWWAFVNEARLHADGFDDTARPYSTTLRPRDVSGAVSVSCERRGARTCGDGGALAAELEPAAGYSSWLTVVGRLRATLGSTDRASEVAVDRLFLRGEVGSLAAQIGRDTFALGPSSRTQLSWGTHAAPLDHVRLGTERPLQLTPSLALSGQYVLGVLRAPQTYPRSLVSIVRGHVDVADNIELGVMQLLQLAGQGAPRVSALDFLLEHVRRGDASAGASDSSNRRFGIDFASRITALRGLRLYYMLVFEDIRRARVVDAVRYDADHLVGVEVTQLATHSLTLEWHKTGVRSHEHSPRTTGFTHAGRVVGSPLGPDAESLYAGARIALGRISLYPWWEVATLHNDRYEFVVDGPITRTSRGEDEGRYRMGLSAKARLGPRLLLEGEAMFEHIDDFAFEPGRARTNIGGAVSLVWYALPLAGTLPPE